MFVLGEVDHEWIKEDSDAASVLYRGASVLLGTQESTTVHCHGDILRWVLKIV